MGLNSIRHNENTTKTYSKKYFQRQQSERNETISIGIGTAKRETDKPIFVCVRLCVCDKIKSFGRLFLKKEKNFSAYTMAWQSSLNGVEFKRGWWRVKTKRMPSHIPFVNSFLFKEWWGNIQLIVRLYYSWVSMFVCIAVQPSSYHFIFLSWT